MTDLETDINAQIEGRDYVKNLPEKGWNKEQVLQEIDSYMSLGNNLLKTKVKIFCKWASTGGVHFHPCAF